MIAKLRGRIDTIGPDWAIIDVGGVGYLVYCSSRTLSRLGPVGETATLSIETHVREDHIHLFGFASTVEREWFARLQTVQGVGAKVALAILSVLPPDELAQALAAQDKAAVARASGVGPKLAARIVNELKDKAAVAAMTAAAPQVASDDAVAGDAVSALVNLGYGRSDAFGAVAAARRKLGADADLGALVKGGLKELSQ